MKIPDLGVEEERESDVLPQVARMSDMDMNGHINNVTYIGWVLETVPPEIQDSSHLYQIEIDYKNECKSGDKVHPLAEECSETPVPLAKGSGSVTYLHSLKRDDVESGIRKELVRARTVWCSGTEEK